MRKTLLHWRPVLAVCFLTTLAILGALNHLHWLVLAVFGGMSVISFMLYGWDKRQATLGRWRTRERTLLTIDLLAGWPGGLIAQRLWHHKHAKTSYQLLYWLMVTINLGLVGGWLYLNQ